MNMSRKDKRKGKNNILKIFTCLVYLVIIIILLVGSYRLFKEKQLVLPWGEIETIEEYTYMDISRMSESFISFENNIGLHFVTEEEKNQEEHTYIIAIDEKEIKKYQTLIDSTYEKGENEKEKIRVYGYPVIIDDEIKDLAIKNIKNFVSDLEITEENYEKYLTNHYLDTTMERKEEFSMTLCASFLLVFVVFGLMIITLLDKEQKEEKGEQKDA